MGPAAEPGAGASLRLETAPNFRDFGGYPTQDGRRVRRGMLFRSGQLSRLDDDDLRRFESFGIRAAIDLRTVDERTAQPARWGADKPPTVHGSSRKSLAEDMLAILGDDGSLENARRGFAAFYARLPEIYADDYRALFRTLHTGDLPLLVKCTAGKDRTGTACAIVLSALRVSRADVIADYAETNTRLAALRRLRGDAPLAGEAGRIIAAHTMSEATRDAIWAADPALLEGALGAIDREYGSVDGYVTDRLGLGTDDLAQIRERLTEPAA